MRVCGRNIRAPCAQQLLIKQGEKHTCSLNQGYEINPDTGFRLTGCTTNHVVAAAAYLGDNLFFKRVPKEEAIQNDNNIYFGTPLECAAKQSHYEITRQIGR